MQQAPGSHQYAVATIVGICYEMNHYFVMLKASSFVFR